MSEQFKLHNIQLVIFPRSFPIPKDRSQLLLKLKKKFDGIETILPIPDEAPPEVPLMILNKQDSFEIKISKARIDYSWFEQSDETIESIIKNKFLPQAKSFFEIVQTIDDIKLGKIGFVIRSFIEDFENVNEKISRSFTDSSRKIFDFSENSDFLLRNTKRHNIEIGDKTFKINEIRLVNTGATSSSTGKKVLFFEFDFNSRADDENFVENKEDMVSLIEKALENYNSFSSDINEKLLVANTVTNE